ncbi:aminoglycoside adenylyltransferase domain-containing protein [Providencia huaxiensis]|uniref:aminoglycoside adenylyltransferase domain-containing protein n=1 Tax=Providencia huaxiensis TaxID=2027290 RepID=UPI0034E5398C
MMVTPPQAEQALVILRKHFSDSLIAVYLHGSSVSSGLWPMSDIDLLVVIDSPVTDFCREQLVRDLMDISGLYPIDLKGRRPLEIVVFLTSELNMLSYPAKCELIYGEWLRTEYEQGVFEGQTQDPEFTLMLAQASQEAVSLWHKEIYGLPIVGLHDIRRAMLDSLPNLELSLKGDERNVLLTLARMWYTMETGLFISKDEAAIWAIELMPVELASVLLVAKKAYLTGISVDWENQQVEVTLCANYLAERIRVYS